MRDSKTPSSRAAYDSRPVNAALHAVVYWLAVDLFVAGVISIVGGKTWWVSIQDGVEYEHRNAIVTGWVCVGASVVLTIWSCMLSLIALHRLWHTVPAEHRRVMKVEPVLLMMVPLFNFFWAYRAVYGLAKDYNRWQAATGGTHQVSEKLFLWYCITAPVFGMPLMLLPPVPPLGFLVVRQIVRAVNAHMKLEHARG